MEANLLDRMIEKYQQDQTPVIFTLQNKIRVHGRIKAFDSYVIVLNNQKQEIVYRHAVSCLVPSVHEERKTAPATRHAPDSAVPKTAKPASRKPRAPQPAAPKMTTAGPESGINNSMRDGLLKWMQDQKAAK